MTIREVAHFLGLSEKDVVECAERGEIPAYKVGGVYLRFQKDQVEHYKHKTKMADVDTAAGLPAQAGVTSVERLRDFFYFYDFYILSAILIVVLLVIITQA